MTKVANLKHATAELNSEPEAGIAKSADSEADKTRRDIRISKTKIRRCQMMRRPYTSTHNPPDRATCWQDIFQP
jgi:hypothetical protein